MEGDASVVSDSFGEDSFGEEECEENFATFF
jgi:hypothetical protein